MAEHPSDSGSEAEDVQSPGYESTRQALQVLRGHFQVEQAGIQRSLAVIDELTLQNEGYSPPRSEIEWEADDEWEENVADEESMEEGEMESSSESGSQGVNQDGYESDWSEISAATTIPLRKGPKRTHADPLATFYEDISSDGFTDKEDEKKINIVDFKTILRPSKLPREADSDGNLFFLPGYVFKYEYE